MFSDDKNKDYMLKTGMRSHFSLTKLKLEVVK